MASSTPRTWSVPRNDVSPEIDCRARISSGAPGATSIYPSAPGVNVSPPPVVVVTASSSPQATATRASTISSTPSGRKVLIFRRIGLFPSIVDPDRGEPRPGTSECSHAGARVLGPPRGGHGRAVGQWPAVRRREDPLLTEILPAEERAVEAVVARYQRVAPAVTRFARSLAGNDDLRVRLGSRTSASPGEIVMDPGVFQAAYARRAPVTPAEVALAAALHEAVHLVATDFDERRPLPPEWFLDRNETLPEDPVPLLDASDRAGGRAAEAMFLAVEDARQESQNLDVFGGVVSVLGDIYRAAIPAAMERARPMGQFALACFLGVGGYQEVDTVQRGAEPAVATALEEARALIAEARRAPGPWEAATVALELLAVAREHGLLTEASPRETRLERAERGESNRDEIDNGVDAVRMISPILRDAESYDATRHSMVQMTSTQGRKGESDEAGDPATDQILRVSEAPDVYLPTGQSGKLIVSRIPDRFGRFAEPGREALSEAARRWEVAQRHISGELHPLFIANQRRGLRSGHDAGDLSPYAALFLGAGLYQRMFERRALPIRRAYAVSLLVDGSRSEE